MKERAPTGPPVKRKNLSQDEVIHAKCKTKCKKRERKKERYMEEWITAYSRLERVRNKEMVILYVEWAVTTKLLFKSLKFYIVKYYYFFVEIYSFFNAS